MYNQFDAAGSYGNIYPDSALVAALGKYCTYSLRKRHRNIYLVVQPLGMDDSPPAPACGWTIYVTNTGSDDGVGGKGNAVTVTVADTCPVCASTHLDLSIGAWNVLTDSAPSGTIEIEWYWIADSE